MSRPLRYQPDCDRTPVCPPLTVGISGYQILSIMIRLEPGLHVFFAPAEIGARRIFGTAM